MVAYSDIWLSTFTFSFYVEFNRKRHLKRNEICHSWQGSIGYISFYVDAWKWTVCRKKNDIFCFFNGLK